MTWLEALAAEELDREEAAAVRAGGAAVSFSEREGLPLNTSDALDQRRAPDNTVSQLDPDAPTRCAAAASHAYLCFSDSSQTSTTRKMQVYRCWSQWDLVTVGLYKSGTTASLNQNGRVRMTDMVKCRRQGKQWAEADVKDNARITERVWQLVRAGRMTDARELCMRCGQAWRAASLGGSFGPGPTPLGAAAVHVSY